MKHPKHVIHTDRYQVNLDPWDIAFLLSTLGEGRTVIDSGAHNAGYLIHFLRQLGPGGRIVAFESQSRPLRFLRSSKAHIHWDNAAPE